MTYPDFCSQDFKLNPYWWDRTPRPAQEDRDLPVRTDVLVIGSGYTGLHCALETARAGRETLVVDAEDAGWGCSTRNGGQVGDGVKPDFDTLCRRYGQELAFALVSEARGALAWLGDFVDDEGIDCDYSRCGRFIGAHNPRQFDRLVRQARYQPPGLELPLRIVSPYQQAAEIDSDYYHGGLVVEHHCALDPARYHQGLLERAIRSGAQVASRCKAISFSRSLDGFRVETSRGPVETRELVVATNGYTAGITPWQRRRVIPIGSYMLATGEMPLERAERLMPANRVISDTRRIVVYFRRSPDGRRLLFGSRVSVFESDPVKCLPALRAEMLRIFPQLEDLPISHSWMGFVAYTFDALPHLGVHDGIHYAMGYCGSGISLASHLGSRLGRQLLGADDSASAFNQPAFATRPLYRGKPWFLSGAVRYYQLLDRLR